MHKSEARQMFDLFLVFLGAVMIVGGFWYAIDVFFGIGDPSDDLTQVFHGSLSAVSGVFILGYGAIHEKLEKKVELTDFGQWNGKSITQ